MWMTSNFRGRACWLSFLQAALVLWTPPPASAAKAQQTTAPQIAPDSPRPSVARRRPAGGGKELSVKAMTVELKSASVRHLDEKMKAMAGAEFLKAAREPLSIEVKTVNPLGNLSRSSLPVIVLNGEKLPGTRATNQTTLVAFLPDRSMLKDSNTIAVVWLGDERTRTKYPLTLKLEEIFR
ncbi:MAG TPA: hypothetical protein VGR03_04245 [Candidatus Acidoferrum sp.]|nr:hypothetical protein [Candidatus Acidoferrum sp.]